MKICFEDVLKNKEFNVYMETADNVLGVLGYTDHSKAHTLKTANCANRILDNLGFTKEECELAKIAGLIHDIGNTINRKDHSITGAMMAFNILTRMGMDPSFIAVIIGAIGNHDEVTGEPISNICAALVIADKTDVRRSRVRNQDFSTFDIHDRVNYAVEHSELLLDSEQRKISLNLVIDSSISSVMDYFEIFLTRMVMCKKSAEFLKANFELIINNVKII